MHEPLMPGIALDAVTASAIFVLAFVDVGRL